MFLNKDTYLVSYNEYEVELLIRKYLDDEYMSKVADSLRSSSNYTEKDINLIMYAIPILKKYIVGMIHTEANITREVNGVHFSSTVEACDNIEMAKIGCVTRGVAFFKSAYEIYRRFIMAKPDMFKLTTTLISARTQVLNIYTGIVPENEYYIIDYQMYNDPKEYKYMLSMIRNLPYARITVRRCTPDNPEGDITDHSSINYGKSTSEISKKFIQITENIRRNGFVMYDAKPVDA